MRLLQILHEHNCRRFIFSSSATVYGTSVAPVTEESPVGVGIANPYGRSKYIVEEVLRDFSKSEVRLLACCARADTFFDQREFLTRHLTTSIHTALPTPPPNSTRWAKSGPS